MLVVGAVAPAAAIPPCARRRLVMVALGVVLTLLIAAPAHAATISVAPGGNLSAAYNGAQSGDVIQLTTGSYGDWSTPSGSKAITVRAAAGTKPKFRTIRASASNMTFEDVEIDAGF